MEAYETFQWVSFMADLTAQVIMLVTIWQNIIKIDVYQLQFKVMLYNEHMSDKTKSLSKCVYHCFH